MNFKEFEGILWNRKEFSGRKFCAKHVHMAGTSKRGIREREREKVSERVSERASEREVTVSTIVTTPKHTTPTTFQSSVDSLCHP